MADDKKATGKGDRERISVSEEYEVQDWVKKFKVTPETLKKVVKELSNMARDVEEFLAKKK